MKSNHRGSDTEPSLIFVTQLVDPDDPVLGFAIGWIDALAARCHRVVVIANEVRHVPATLDAEVLSLGKERGRGRARRSARYLRILQRLARQHDWAALLAHMCPDYLVAAAPVLRLHRIPAYLWFVHSAYRRRLRWAERVATGVFTALPGSYPGRHPRVHVIGHAIDVEAYVPSPLPQRASGLRCVALGRTSPVKGLDTVVEGVKLARDHGADVTLSIVGPSTTDESRAHRGQLERRIRHVGLSEAVTLEEGRPPREVPGILRGAHLLVNATEEGSGDKVVFEAMAAGRPVVVSNPAFAPLLSDLSPALMFRPGDSVELSERFLALSGLDDAALAAIAATLRARVVRQHSLEGWADRVFAVITGTTPPMTRDACARP